MFIIDSADVSALETARTGAGVTGFFNDDVAGAGTVISAEYMNMLMKELNALVTVVGGLVLNKADDTQLTAVLGHIRALVSDAADTTSTTTIHSRAVIATLLCRASGPLSAVMASGTSHASGDYSAIAGCLAVDNAGDRSVIVASDDGVGTTAIDATSIQSAIVASEDATITGGDNSGIVASKGATVTGAQAAVIASEDDVSATGSESACIACGTTAGGGIETSGVSSAAIGVLGGVVVAGAASVCLASDFDLDAGTVTEPTTVFGGDGSTVLWKIKSATGAAEFEALDVNDGAAISGAAGPPTLAANVNGATGPGTNAQNQWLEISINGTPHWVPVWV